MSETQVGSVQDPLGSVAGALDLVSKAAHDGATDARAAAIQTWDATSRFASRFIYTTSYSFSYGMVFPAVLVARSIPRNNAVVRGLVDGAHDAIHKVEAMRGTSIDSAVPAVSST